jgi:hypothetical protein
MSEIDERQDGPDQPWNDVAGDAGLPAEVDEPDPGEVEGEEGEEEDTSAPRIPTADDEYRRETLDERLAEEEPEARLHRTANAEAGELVDPQRGGDDVQRGEAHGAGDDPGDSDLGAEDAAIHVVEDDRV